MINFTFKIGGDWVIQSGGSRVVDELMISREVALYRFGLEEIPW